MSVYVDDAFIPFGRMVMCHMIADTHTELMTMADTIGVARKWIQNEGLAHEHFDVAKAARAKAVAAGAQEIDTETLAKMLKARKANWSLKFTLEAKQHYYGS